MSSSPLLISPQSVVRSFPEPPGKVHLLYGSGAVFPFSLTMAAHALQQGMPLAVVDGANRFDVHLLARFARERRLNADAFLRRIYISRGFTCYQMEQAVVNRLPLFLQRVGSNVAMVFGLLDTFYDEQAPLREVRQILGRVQTAFGAMKADGISILVVCLEQKVWPEERNQLFARLKNGMDRVYRLDGEGGRLVAEGREKEVARRAAKIATAAEKEMKLEAIDDTHKTIAKERHVEIDQNAQSKPGKPQISQQLFLVDRQHRLHGFQLEND